MTAPTIARNRPAEGKQKQIYLTVPEVCAELDITRSTFYDWRAKRTGPPCVKLPNGSIRIRRAAFDAWINSREESW
ncbi:helix-turn-helix transcriptional regulator [Catelliglobosispora koreensis]|uniref:helix-turn-helix transcriptional regulator n=1 Tax=Catelliglobosispora koreensis TaxID=129052 RepID=UPI0003A88E04|nr:helix-turn-helix domain-containing protein [Catelliglobosispora koreensis]